jgi:filamentous hemagglutinin family protein
LIALNRIHDQNPSQILGTLNANGRVVLVNANGVFFGPSSTVNIAGVIASTADIERCSSRCGHSLSAGAQNRPARGA